MATTKTIQATIKNRTDTAANWTQKNPVFAEGEIIVVQTSAGETRLKIGDGVKSFTQLPYTDEQIYNNVVTSVNGQTGDVTLTNESKSLGLTSAAVGQIPKVKAVDSNGVPTEWESVALPSGSAGSMKKLTFTGAVTGEYDGSNDISIDIPSDVYIAQINATSSILINDYDELVSAIKSHKIIILLFGENAEPIVISIATFDSTKVTLGVPMQEHFIDFTIAKDTKKLTASYLYHFSMKIQEGVDPKSGIVYFDETTGLCSTKDNVSPIATVSTAGIIKVGNGLSISADGTLSVTTATYYTGTTDPVNTLGADGDLYLKTEG